MVPGLCPALSILHHTGTGINPRSVESEDLHPQLLNAVQPAFLP